MGSEFWRPSGLLPADILSSTGQLGAQTRGRRPIHGSGMNSKIRTIDRRPTTRRTGHGDTAPTTAKRTDLRGKRPFPSSSGADKPGLRAPLSDVPRVGQACVLAEAAIDRVAGGTVLCVEVVWSLPLPPMIESLPSLPFSTSLPF